MDKLSYVVLAFALLVLGCDGSLAVSGEIMPKQAYANQDCEISLWSSGKAIWESEENTYKYRYSQIRGQFDVHWTIGGPQTKSWIEIRCPGYRIFKTEKFEAPSTVRTKDIGVVRLEKVVEHEEDNQD